VRPYYPASESTKAQWMGWQAPIASVVQVGGYPIGELWWELEVGRPFQALAREVLMTVQEYALPAMRERMEP